MVKADWLMKTYTPNARNLIANQLVYSFLVGIPELVLDFIWNHIVLNKNSFKIWLLILS